MYEPLNHQILIYSLLYLHTGSPIEGIAHPILWKASPNKTEMAIISKCNNGEISLAQGYLETKSESRYTPPPVSELCSIAIKIVQVLEQIHGKQVRHGNLRPDVIGFWVINGEFQVCIRDFTESTLLGGSDTPVNASPVSESPQANIPPTTCLHYMCPEAITRNRPSLSNSLLFCLS